MRSVLTRAAAAAGILVIAAGCAHVGGSKVDPDGVYNAILQDDVAEIRALVHSGTLAVNQSIPVPGYREGTPLLTVAARSASLAVIRYLLSAGADVNARTPVNETALMLAAYFHDDDIARSANARVRHDEAVRILLGAGADIENDPYHYTPLSYAAYQGNDIAVGTLLAHGARVDADAENGSTYINTPLMMAAIQGHESTVLQLLRAGANAAIRIRGGHTAAELAAKYRHANLAQLLHCAERHSPGRFVAQRCQGGVAEEGATTRVRLEQRAR